MMNTIRQIQGNLDTTRETLLHIFEQVSERGTHVERLEDQAEDLVATSDVFYDSTLPGWKRYLRTWRPPMWWWQRLGCGRCCRKKKIRFT